MMVAVGARSNCNKKGKDVFLGAVSMKNAYVVFNTTGGAAFVDSCISGK